MFGYIEPDKGELKMKELTRYRAFYCALCKSIGARYSQTAQLRLRIFRPCAMQYAGAKQMRADALRL